MLAEEDEYILDCVKFIESIIILITKITLLVVNVEVLNVEYC